MRDGEGSKISGSSVPVAFSVNMFVKMGNAENSGKVTKDGPPEQSNDQAF